MSEKSASHRSTGEKTTGRESTDRHVHSLLFYGLPPVLWMGMIFILSAQPTLPRHPDTLFDTILKKAGHMVEYGILTFLLWRAISRGRGTLSRSALVTAFVISVLYAASDEYHQTWVPGRHGRLVDVGIDTVGSLIALLVVRSLKGRRG